MNSCAPACAIWKNDDLLVCYYYQYGDRCVGVSNCAVSNSRGELAAEKEGGTSERDHFQAPGSWKHYG
ncbi:hypothetical protein B9Z55_006875 [Caenorhabditis nigoni]|uniref:Uncharacterized protein n=1 Tax=Caenorhabditis nigoni TaxID=1611254 RepID=A0A2G5V7D3_9PELO|nr:hypothetical protein B9Z55_006875 [Caenorhabditis nigoni]